MRFLPLVVALAACKSPVASRPQAVDGRGLVGVEWITPPQPWRAATPGLGVAVVGDVAVVAGWRGWIGAIDLATGAVVRERWIDGEIWELARLRDGRLLALGQRDDAHSIAMTLDARTLAATPITLPGAQERWLRTDLTVLADGGVVITGPELPLAIYDPATWLERRVLDVRLGWGTAIELGGTLLVQRNSEADDLVARFDLATGTQVATLGPARHLAAGGGVVARSVMDAGFDSARVEVEIHGQLRHTIPGIDMGIAVDAAGTRLLVHSDHDEVTVYALPSGEQLRKISLDQAGVVVRTFQLTDTRAVMLAGATVRVVDLTTGAITPGGSPPFGAPTSLTVSDAGEVGFIGSAAWRLVRGKVAATFAIGGELRLEPAPGEVRRFAIADEGGLTVKSLDDGRSLRHLAIDEASYPGWFAGDDYALAVTSPQRSRLLRSNGRGFVPVVDFNTEAQLDVDLRGDRALVAWHGTAHLVSLRDGTRSHTVPIPGCNDKHAILERGGPRVATSDDHTATIWDGATALATTRFDDDNLVSIAFVPGTGDVVLLLQHHLALWTPATGELRTIGVSSIFAVAVSPNGRRLALAFGDDRVAVVDVAALRAAVTVERAAVGQPPPPCPPSDPFVVGTSPSISPPAMLPST